MLRFILKPKKKQGWEKELERLAEAMVQQEIKGLRLRRKYASVLTMMEEVTDEQENLKVQIQQIAREHATVGKTLRFVDNKDITIEVQGPQASVQFDYRKARKYWPKEILRRVLRVDSAAVMELVAEGEIDDRQYGLVALPREALSPRVTVKVKNGKS